MAAPRRRQRRTGTSSSSPALSSQGVASWAQKTRLARGQLSRALSTRPPSIGSQSRKGNRLWGSGYEPRERLIAGPSGGLAHVLTKQAAQLYLPSHLARGHDDRIAA